MDLEMEGGAVRANLVRCQLELQTHGPHMNTTAVVIYS